MPWAFRKRGFVRAARSVVGASQEVVQRIGNAIIGGNFTGAARGEYAIDVQLVRETITQVAGGAQAVAFGNANEASGAQAVTFGVSNVASGTRAVALGVAARATRGDALALGDQAEASGSGSIALGALARAAVDNTLNWGAVPLLRRGADVPVSLQWFTRLSSVEVVLSTGRVDLCRAGDYAFTLPGGAHFFAREVGIIATAVSGLVAQPTIRFGVSGAPALLVPPTACTLLTAAFCRENLTAVSGGWQQGLTTISGGVVVPASATLMQGRFYFQGLLIEDE